MGIEAVVTPARVQTFMLIMTRVGTVIMSMPFLGAGNVPKMVRATLGLTLSLLMMPVVHVEGVDQPLGTLELIFGLGYEVIIGVLIGFSATLLMGGIMLSGQLNGVQMGFAIANMIDPQNQGQFSIIAVFKSMLATLVFISLDIHHMMIRALQASFETLPPLGYGLSKNVFLDLVHLGREIFVTGIKLAAPIFAVTLFTQVSLGIVTRTVPSMGVLFNIGFTVTILLGLITLALALPYYGTSLAQIFGHLEVVLGRWVGL